MSRPSVEAVAAQIRARLVQAGRDPSMAEREAAVRLVCHQRFHVSPRAGCMFCPEPIELSRTNLRVMARGLTRIDPLDDE